MLRRVVLFPAPLAPIRVDDLPGLHGQADPLQRVDGAVVDVKVSDLQQRHLAFRGARRGTLSITLGSWRNRRGVPPGR